MIAAKNKKAVKKKPDPAKLRETKKFYRDILDSIADPVFVKDEEHCWIEGNAAFWKLMGAPKEKFLNRSDYEIFSKKEADLFWKRDDIVLKKHRSHVNTENITPSSGKTTVAQTKKAPITLPNGEVGLVGVIRDITSFVEMREELRKHRDSLQELVEERTKDLEEAKNDLIKKNEELLETNKELEDFSYIVTHDIRSPLINIEGFAGELKIAIDKIKAISQNPEIEKIIEGEIAESISYISKAVKSLDNITNSILEFSRKGKIEIKFEKVCSRQIVDEVLSRYSHQLRQKNIKVKLGNLPAIKSDYISLQEVISNIVDNAIKYMPANKNGIIEISAKYQSTKKQFLFTIKDNGGGIIEEAKGKVFQIMRRATLDKSVQGHGMGMPYAKTVLKRLGGKIWFDSKLGEGTTFYFSVPYVTK